jgi:hypothetical protein
MATRKSTASRSRSTNRTPAEPTRTDMTTPATAGANTDRPSESETTRIAQLSQAGADEELPATLTARDYFGRVGKNLDAPALVGDIVGLLEHLGLIDAPESHAPIS